MLVSNKDLMASSSPVVSQRAVFFQLTQLSSTSKLQWMDLESVIQSKVNQKEKNKYHILTHICGI